MSALTRAYRAGGKYTRLAQVQLSSSATCRQSFPSTSLSPASRSCFSTLSSPFTRSLNPDRPRLVLGVETSCDDTALAIVSTDGRVLANQSVPQWQLFDKFAGIQPMHAANAHQEAIDHTFEQVLAQAKLNNANELDGIAVTAGPGLAPCLRVGLRWSTELAKQHQLPLIGVHHMLAHAYVASLDHAELQFPFVALLISGGHTELWLVESLSKIHILSRTLDDAIGEAFDKGCRVIGVQRLPNEAPGKAVERMALLSPPLHASHPFNFSRMGTENFEFSFSGLKSALMRQVFTLQLAQAKQRDAATSSSSSSSASVKLHNADVQRLLKAFKANLFRNVEDDAAATASSSSPSTTSSDLPALPPLSERVQTELCRAFQDALIDQLCSRTQLALHYLLSPSSPLYQSSSSSATLPKHFVVAGGVACNATIRQALQATVSEFGMQLLAPRPLHCMDNGIMIGWLGQELLKQGHTDVYDLAFHTRWPVGNKIDMKAALQPEVANEASTAKTKEASATRLPKKERRESKIRRKQYEANVLTAAGIEADQTAGNARSNAL